MMQIQVGSAWSQDMRFRASPGSIAAAFRTQMHEFRSQNRVIEQVVNKCRVRETDLLIFLEFSVEENRCLQLPQREIQVSCGVPWQAVVLLI